jgi:hypothetical protein
MKTSSLIAATVSKRDAKRLSPWLSGWTRLNRILVRKPSPLSRADLSKLLRLELDGKHRQAIMERLIGRITSMDRDAAWQQILEETHA